MTTLSNSRHLLRATSLMLATVVASGTLAMTTSALPAAAAGPAVDETAADFQLGTTGSTYVSDSSGGEVILAPTLGTSFDEGTLPAGWTDTPWMTGGASIFSPGQVTVDGSLLHTASTYPAGRSVEFDAVFANGALNQHAGFGVDVNLDGHWAIFSTGDTGTELIASVFNDATPGAVATPLSASYLGSSHHYRIDWTTSSIVFSIDGTAVHTENVTDFSTPMSPVVSDYTAADGSSITVSSLRMSPYASTGTFTSRVHDAGGLADWGALGWTSTAPALTGLTLGVRTGNTASPDGTWSAFTPISNGGNVTTYGRYLQYQATETTSDASVTPALDSVSIAYTVDAVAPTISSHTPISDATGVAVSAKPTVTFSEPVAQTSITTSSVSVRADGASSDVAASLATSGPTVTVTPSADLALGTKYTVTVSTAVTDLVGNHLASAVSWPFTTVFGTLTTAVPTINGTVGVGRTLTAATDPWGPDPVSLAYQWLRNGSPVASATTSSHAVTTADMGSKLSVTVTGTKAGYTTASQTSAETATVEPGTFVPATPTITGTPAIGGLLTAHPGTWDPVPDSLTYQWLRGSTEISGATDPTYTVTAADAGATLKVRVTGTKTSYTTVSITSDPTGVVPKGTLSPTPTPTISGTVVVSQVLTAEPGNWGPGTVSLAYQWLRGSSEISGATAKTYQVTGADADATLAVRVTGAKDGYTSVSMTSAATRRVPSILAPNPTVTGVARVGMPLKAVPGTWVPTPTKVTYQWYWLKSSGARVTIKHATKAGYTPTGSVQGHRLQVRVKPYRSGTLIATRYSGPTVKVAAGMTGKTPKISDSTPAVGQILTVKPGTWKPTQTTFAYQWYAKSKSGKVSKIAGATAATYQVAAGYAGYQLKVTVTGTAPDYKPVTKSSSYTHKITK